MINIDQLGRTQIILGLDKSSASLLSSPQPERGGLVLFMSR